MPDIKKRGGEYIRDGRAPIPKSEITSKVMSKNRGTDTQLEISIRKALWRNGLRGFRINVRKLPGRPDIVFTKHRLAIFVHGCFWHRCPTCQPSLPKTHPEFWAAKFERNTKRDAKALEDLRSLGWMSLLIWECEASKDMDGMVERVKQALEGSDDRR